MNIRTAARTPGALSLLTLTASVGHAQEVEASTAEALARANACLTCHNVNSKVVGPAYTDVADKYRGDDSALETLVAKVRDGGAGSWGSYPMPANAHVPEETIRTIVSWILAMEPE